MMKIKNLLFLLLTVSSFSFIEVYSQSEFDYDNKAENSGKKTKEEKNNEDVENYLMQLRTYNADKKYIKTIDKGESWSKKDILKKNPEIYIILSEAYFEIIQDAEYSKKIPNAYVKALSYAKKFSKLDSKREYYKTYKAYIEKLKMTSYEEIQNYLLVDNLIKDGVKGAKKAKSQVKNIIEIDPFDKGAALLSSVIELITGNTFGGTAMLKEIMPEINEICTGKKTEKKKSTESYFDETPFTQFADLTLSQQNYLLIGLVVYARYLNDKKKSSEAKEIIELGKNFFYMENKDYKGELQYDYIDVYNEITKK